MQGDKLEEEWIQNKNKIFTSVFSGLDILYTKNSRNATVTYSSVVAAW